MEKTQSLSPKNLWIAAALIGSVFAVFGRSLHYDFVYDDQWTIVQNTSLKSLLSLGRFFLDKTTTADPSSELPNLIYRPLPTLTFAADYHAWGFNTAPWRFENLLVHGLCGTLVFFFLLTQVKLSRTAAALGSLLFLFHPVQVETAVWINQRSNMLCFLGMAGGLWLLAKPFSIPRFLGALLALAAALLSKETAAVFPALVILQDLQNVKRGEEKKRLKERIGIYAVLSLVILAYIALRCHVTGQLSQRELRTHSHWGDLLMGADSWLEYWKLLLVPLHLTVSHGQTIDNPWNSPGPWVGALFLGACAILGTFLWRRRSKPEGRTAAGSLAWIFITLLPVLGIFPIDAVVCERFLYVPLFGAAVLWGWSWDALSRKKSLEMTGKSILVLITAAWITLSFQRTPAWENELTLWQSAVQEEPRNAFAHACCAEAYAQRGLLPDAIQEYEATLAHEPSVEIAYAALTNLSDLSNRIHEPDASLQWSQKALEIHPDSFPALYNRIESLGLLGKKQKALELLKQTRALYPDAVNWPALQENLRHL